MVNEKVRRPSGKRLIKTTNSVHATVTVLCMSALRVAPGNGWEGLVSEKPPFS